MVSLLAILMSEVFTMCTILAYRASIAVSFCMSTCIYWSLRLELFLQVKILPEQFMIQEQFQGGGGDSWSASPINII